MVQASPACPLWLSQSFRKPHTREQQREPHCLGSQPTFISSMPRPNTASTSTLPLAVPLDSNHGIAPYLQLLLGNPEIPGQEGPDPGHTFLPLNASVTSLGRSYSDRRLSLSPLPKWTGLKGQGSVPGKRARLLGAASGRGVDSHHRTGSQPAPR